MWVQSTVPWSLVWYPYCNKTSRNIFIMWGAQSLNHWFQAFNKLNQRSLTTYVTPAKIFFFVFAKANPKDLPLWCKVLTVFILTQNWRAIKSSTSFFMTTEKGLKVIEGQVTVFQYPWIKIVMNHLKLSKWIRDPLLRARWLNNLILLKRSGSNTKT